MLIVIDEFKNMNFYDKFNDIFWMYQHNLYIMNVGKLSIICKPMTEGNNYIHKYLRLKNNISI